VRWILLALSLLFLAPEAWAAGTCTTNNDAGNGTGQGGNKALPTNSIYTPNRPSFVTACVDSAGTLGSVVVTFTGQGGSPVHTITVQSNTNCWSNGASCPVAGAPFAVPIPNDIQGTGTFSITGYDGANGTGSASSTTMYTVVFSSSSLTLGPPGQPQLVP
jgi:hypothetical protein